MGKTDKLQIGLTYESKRSACDLLEAETDKEVVGRDVGTLESTLLAMQHSLQTTASKIDKLNLCMDDISCKLDQHTERLTEEEHGLSITEDTVQTMLGKLLNMEKVLAVIKANKEDLEKKDGAQSRGGSKGNNSSALQLNLWIDLGGAE
ncbi:hypothetical protein NDU88_002942 [Pleurodeles waltl]|uniref:Uncharacterized protein n=1 Tax=Pleurodeles waltl TaxID=8319 RepID=A0AAV7RF86_PLEWA|nr:hypothetical protein NDU88_002942 [Pleurodeles waltl]